MKEYYLTALISRYPDAEVFCKEEDIIVIIKKTTEKGVKIKIRIDFFTYNYNLKISLKNLKRTPSNADMQLLQTVFGPGINIRSAYKSVDIITVGKSYMGDISHVIDTQTFLLNGVFRLES